jgi:nucleotide-binding universal stress UspA family protein
MKGLASIVVGLDFSECSRVALGHAQRVASWAGAQVHPVHVVDAPVDETSAEAALTVMQREIREGLVEDARKRWDAFVEGSPDASGLRLDVCVAHRLVGIRQQLDRHSADLLVLGAFGDEKPSVGMGTLASACVRSVPTDVLIVRDNYRDPFRTVVVGIDFSATCQRALEAAALIAHGEGAKLYAAHVVPARIETFARLRNELGPELNAFVNETTRKYPGLDAHARVFPYSGYRSGVLEFAALVNADLVAVGTRGQSNLRDVVLGSTAEKILRDSVCAVWAAKPRL